MNIIYFSGDRLNTTTFIVSIILVIWAMGFIGIRATLLNFTLLKEGVFPRALWDLGRAMAITIFCSATTFWLWHFRIEPKAWMEVVILMLWVIAIYFNYQALKKIRKVLK